MIGISVRSGLPRYDDEWLQGNLGKLWDFSETSDRVTLATLTFLTTSMFLTASKMSIAGDIKIIS